MLKLFSLLTLVHVSLFVFNLFVSLARVFLNLCSSEYFLLYLVKRIIINNICR